MRGSVRPKSFVAPSIWSRLRLVTSTHFKMMVAVVAAFATISVVAPSTASAAPSAAAQTACHGTLTFGRIVTCPSIVDAARQVYHFTSTVDHDLLRTDLSQGTGVGVGGVVTTPDGTFVCPVFNNPNTCQLAAAGTYTLTVTTDYGTGTGNYTLSIESSSTPSKCTTLPASFFSWASPGVTATLPVGAAAQCFTFDQAVGSVLFVADPGGAGDVQGVAVDATGQGVCSVRYTTTCTLTTAGPYRLFMYETYGAASTYTLRLPRISQSAGCPVLKVAPFGAPGDATATGTVTAAGVASCQKVRVPAGGSVGFRFDEDQNLSWALYSPSGVQVCNQYYNTRACPIAAAGDYTMVLQPANYAASVTYTLAVPAQFRNTGCTAGTGTAWDADALLLHQTSGVQENCQPFHGDAGDRIVFYAAASSYNDVDAWLVDATGTPVCPSSSGQAGCVLPATGTYRLLSYLHTWDPQSTDLTYQVQIRRLNNPVGCPVIRPGAYNAAPAGALGNIRCRILNIPTAGKYLVSPVDAANHVLYGQVYDGSGTEVCGTGYCTFPAAGRYTMVLDGPSFNAVVDNDFQYLVGLVPVVPAHCGTVADSADPIAPYQDTMVAGQYDCLQLPTPAGGSVVELLPATATGTTYPSVTIVDSLGAYVCDSYQLRQISCTLNGTGPFHAIVTAGDYSAPGAYTMAFARVDGPPACPVLPSTAAGTSVTTSAGHFATCLSIPADQRGTRESYTVTRTSGSGDATVSVIDGAGLRYCQTYVPAVTQTLTCSMPAGPATVIVQADDVDATYQVTYTEPATP